MISYLDYAEAALKVSGTASQFKRRILAQYPDYGCGKVLDHQLRFLFR
jgi:hypothetical protein